MATLQTLDVSSILRSAHEAERVGGAHHAQIAQIRAYLASVPHEEATLRILIDDLALDCREQDALGGNAPFCVGLSAALASCLDARQAWPHSIFTAYLRGRLLLQPWVAPGGLALECSAALTDLTTLAHLSGGEVHDTHTVRRFGAASSVAASLEAQLDARLTEICARVVSLDRRAAATDAPSHDRREQAHKIRNDTVLHAEQSSLVAHVRCALTLVKECMALPRVQALFLQHVWTLLLTERDVFVQGLHPLACACLQTLTDVLLAATGSGSLPLARIAHALDALLARYPRQISGGTHPASISACIVRLAEAHPGYLCMAASRCFSVAMRAHATPSALRITTPEYAARVAASMARIVKLHVPGEQPHAAVLAAIAAVKVPAAAADERACAGNRSWKFLYYASLLRALLQTSHDAARNEATAALVALTGMHATVSTLSGHDLASTFFGAALAFCATDALRLLSPATAAVPQDTLLAYARRIGVVLAPKALSRNARALQAARAARVAARNGQEAGTASAAAPLTKPAAAFDDDDGAAADDAEAHGGASDAIEVGSLLQVDMTFEPSPPPPDASAAPAATVNAPADAVKNHFDVQSMWAWLHGTAPDLLLRHVVDVLNLVEPPELSLSPAAAEHARRSVMASDDAGANRSGGRETTFLREERVMATTSASSASTDSIAAAAVTNARTSGLHVDCAVVCQMLLSATTQALRAACNIPIPDAASLAAVVSPLDASKTLSRLDDTPNVSLSVRDGVFLRRINVLQQALAVSRLLRLLRRVMRSDAEVTHLAAAIVAARMQIRDAMRSVAGSSGSSQPAAPAPAAASARTVVPAMGAALVRARPASAAASPFPRASFPGMRPSFVPFGTSASTLAAGSKRDRDADAMGQDDEDEGGGSSLFLQARPSTAKKARPAASMVGITGAATVAIADNTHGQKSAVCNACLDKLPAIPLMLLSPGTHIQDLHRVEAISIAARACFAEVLDLTLQPFSSCDRVLLWAACRVGGVHPAELEALVYPSSPAAAIFSSYVHRTGQAVPAHLKDITALTNMVEDEQAAPRAAAAAAAAGRKRQREHGISDDESDEGVPNHDDPSAAPRRSTRERRANQALLRDQQILEEAERSMEAKRVKDAARRRARREANADGGSDEDVSSSSSSEGDAAPGAEQAGGDDSDYDAVGEEQEATRARATPRKNVTPAGASKAKKRPAVKRMAPKVSFRSRLPAIAAAIGARLALAAVPTIPDDGMELRFIPKVQALLRRRELRIDPAGAEGRAAARAAAAASDSVDVTAFTRKQMRAAGRALRMHEIESKRIERAERIPFVRYLRLRSQVDADQVPACTTPTLAANDNLAPPAVEGDAAEDGAVATDSSAPIVRYERYGRPTPSVADILAHNTRYFLHWSLPFPRPGHLSTVPMVTVGSGVLFRLLVQHVALLLHDMNLVLPSSEVLNDCSQVMPVPRALRGEQGTFATSSSARYSHLQLLHVTTFNGAPAAAPVCLIDVRPPGGSAAAVEASIDHVQLDTVSAAEAPVAVAGAVIAEPDHVSAGVESVSLSDDSVLADITGLRRIADIDARVRDDMRRVLRQAWTAAAVAEQTRSSGASRKHAAGAPISLVSPSERFH